MKNTQDYSHHVVALRLALDKFEHLAPVNDVSQKLQALLELSRVCQEAAKALSTYSRHLSEYAETLEQKEEPDVEVEKARSIHTVLGRAFSSGADVSASGEANEREQ